MLILVPGELQGAGLSHQYVGRKGKEEEEEEEVHPVWMVSGIGSNMVDPVVVVMEVVGVCLQSWRETRGSRT